MGACAGIKVIEFGSMVTAPLTGQLLGDFGAEVIKIEPLGGEVMRGIPPLYKGTSAAFAQWNRNKKSVAIDLKKPSGVAAARKIVASADVIISNMRPASMKAHGFDYETVAKANPGIVYLTLSGFGSDGPYSELSAYDMVIQGLVGMMPNQGGDDSPQPFRTAVADKISAYSGAMAILTALLHRKDTGQGQEIQISMMDAYASFVLPELFYTQTFEDAPPPTEWVKSIYNQFEISDGWVIGFVMNDRHFEAVCDTFRLDSLRHDPRFADPGGRNVYQPELMAAIQKACAHMSVAEFVALARQNDIPFGPVNDLKNFMRDPQAVHNETFVSFTSPRRPDLGGIRLLNNCARMSATPLDARHLAPELGGDTIDVLRGVGISDEEMNGLTEDGAIANTSASNEYWN